MSTTVADSQVLKGSEKTWGIWERLVPSLIDDRDEAGKRMMEIHMRRYRTAQKHVAGKRVLDVASGTGYGSRMLKDAGATIVTGIDLSADAVQFAKVNYQCDGIDYLIGNAEEFTVDEPYDVVTSFETIEHLPHPTEFLARVRESLKPGGTFLMSVPIGETRHIDGFHLHVFGRADVYKLLAEAGFQVEAFRFDDWTVSLKEILTWPKIYPESRVPIRELLFTWRGRRVLQDLILRRSIQLPMLMLKTTRAEDIPCATMDESSLASLDAD